MPVFNALRTPHLHPPTARPSLRKTIALLLAALLAMTTLVMVSQPAHAEGTDIVYMPDVNLKAAVNTALGGGRAADADFTYADVARFTGLTAGSATVAIDDLTGMEAFVSLTQLIIGSSSSDNGFSDLTPLQNLTKLTKLYLYNGKVTDLGPLAGLTDLAYLNLTGNRISDISPIAGLTKLDALTLASNQISTLDTLPASDFASGGLNLMNNQISDVSSLANQLTSTKILVLNLKNNRITDPSPIATKFASSSLDISSSTKGVLLAGNRIKDFSSFSGWSALTDTSKNLLGQVIYVGAYPAGGARVFLTSAKGTSASVAAADGSYDTSTGLLTLVDPAAATVAVSPLWTVYFQRDPEDSGTRIGDAEGNELTATAKIGDLLTVSAKGDLFTTTPCAADYSYRWLRDGKEFSGNTYFGEWSLPENELNGGGDSSNVSSWLGGPGTHDFYRVSATDVGHTLSVRVSCAVDARSATSPQTAIVEAAEAELPVVQTLSDTTVYVVSGEVRPKMLHILSGVVGDPTNPTLPIYVGQLDANNKLVNPESLTVAVTAVTSSGDSPRPEVNDVTITGTGAERVVSVNPTQKIGTNGAATITLTVTGTSGKITTLDIPYKASVATTPTSRVLLGTSDASSAISVGNGYWLVADDEDDLIRLYDSTTSSRNVNQFLPYSGNNSGEIDFEASARRGDTIYWLGSHSNAKDGSLESSRYRIFRTTVSGSGATTALSADGLYAGLRTDLVNWDTANGNTLGFAAGAKKGVGPNELGGFDIEGAEFSPDEKSLYLGMRSPVSPAAVGGKAVIVPVTNIDAVIDGTEDHASFADAILLDLGGDSIRELRRNDRNEYLILSAKAGGDSDASSQHLWAWDGQPDSKPRLLTTQLPTDVEPDHTDNAGAWEGIGEMPARLVPGAQVRLVMDQGYDLFYDSGNTNKKAGFDSKARTDVVTLTGAVGTMAEASDPGDFGSQAVSTLSAPRKVTVTNTGSNPLNLGKVKIIDSDQASADDFLISSDGCADTTLAEDETCTVAVRFAPTRDNATSAAQLRIASDVPTKATLVALTGNSTSAPASAPTEVIAGTAVIVGITQVDQKVVAVPSGWSAGASFSYQWLIDGTPITGATGAQYTPVSADAGKALTVSITGSLAGAADATAASDPLTVSTAQLATATPVISGVAQVEQTVTAESGVWSDGTSLSYRWLRNGKAIAGADGRTYTLTAADAGTILVVEVTGSKPGYDSQFRNSTPVFLSEGDLVANSPVTTPTINGRVQTDQVVTVNAGTWPEGVTLSYRWLRDGVPITGATGSRYRISGSDAGHGLTVQVFANKTGYTTVIATSPVAVVAKGTLASSRPSIRGNARVGKKLRIMRGNWSTGVTFSYRWRANGKNIAQATHATLKLTRKLRGKKISVTIIATKTGYNRVAKTSKATKKVRR